MTRYRIVDLVMTIEDVRLDMGTLDSARLKERGQELNAALGNLIAEERKARGWSQTDLADRMDMAQSAIATYEGGGRQLGALHVHIIEALEQVFELPKGSILDRLGLIARHIDFETFVLSYTEMPEALRYAFRDLHRAYMSKGGLPGIPTDE